MCLAARVAIEISISAPVRDCLNVAVESPYTVAQLDELGLQPDRLPRHIAIIMDGNGRWAQARGLPRIEGHRRGVQSVRTVVEECARLGLDQLTLYCFSSENWKRPRLELDLLMSLLQRYVVAEREEIMRQDLRFQTIGRTDRISPRILGEVNETIELSRNNPGMRLCLALDYGARDEMVTAVRKISEKVAQGLLDPGKIDEDTISEHLYTAGMIDPDLVIRTAGEMRISNFLLWQISYAELWVTETPWPDFRQPELFAALRDYGSRERRFGGLKTR
jgi:undecaprenyl diphosphate synthase